MSWFSLWIRKKLLFTILVSLLTLSCGKPKEPTKLPLSTEGFIIQDVWIDDRFTFDEYQAIRAAADEWLYVTRSIVQYRLHYPYYISNRDFRVKIDRNVIVKTDSLDSFVIKTDDQISINNKRNGIDELRVTSGFYTKPDSVSDYWFIGIVSNRILDTFGLKTVTIHEFGHALALEHQEIAKGIMNGSADMTIGCLNRYDVVNFVKLYRLDLEMMNYCSQR